MQALRIREKCLLPDDPEIGNSYSNLGYGFIDQGQYRKAQEYYRKAIEVHERTKEPSDDLLEDAYSCMGKRMLYLGHLEDAERWILKAMTHHKNLKTENFFVAETLFALGSLRMKPHTAEFEHPD
ncbi:hypothetical protein AK830_g8522 [Neonectria ditissima]|uniref:Uncharacterized protein n=1 Tax=Neonectria ditissima TaxID=78410 RepID=A0A0P7BC43_9HYPO|nr:hypothetical protein AK830_g8522 [Neonectria ditissima]